MLAAVLVLIHIAVMCIGAATAVLVCQLIFQRSL